MLRFRHSFPVCWEALAYRSGYFHAGIRRQPVCADLGAVLGTVVASASRPDQGACVWSIELHSRDGVRRLASGEREVALRECCEWLDVEIPRYVVAAKRLFERRSIVALEKSNAT